MILTAGVAPRRHLSALDGLRGFAAVAVVLYHTSLIFPDSAEGFFGRSLPHSSALAHGMLMLPLRVATCGPQAVILFFVLSGFVLTRAMISLHDQSYAQFAIKRFFRIWPAFAVAILLSAGMSLVIGRHMIVGGSAWLHEIWSRGGTTGNIWRHLLMTETRVDLDNVMWSLIHELRISFLFPAIFLTVRKWPVPICLASVMLMVIACWASPFFLQKTVIQSYIETASYVFLFAFGAALSIALLENKPRRYSWPISSIALAFFVILLIAGPKDTAHVASIADGLRLLICGVGATGILYVTLNSGFSGFFSSGTARYLGRISYSLYLIHVVILAAVLNALSNRLSVGTSAFVALIVMLPLADIFQRLIERPSDRLGRRIVETVNHRAVPMPKPLPAG